MKYEVINVRYNGFSGVSDDKIYEIAVEQKRVLIIMDKDFLRVKRFPPENCGGIIVCKLYRMTVEETTELFKKYFKILDLDRIEKRLVIITPEKVRFRSKS